MQQALTWFGAQKGVTPTSISNRSVPKLHQSTPYLQERERSEVISLRLAWLISVRADIRVGQATDDLRREVLGRPAEGAGLVRQQVTRWRPVEPLLVSHAAHKGLHVLRYDWRLRFEVEAVDVTTGERNRRRGQGAPRELCGGK